MHDFSVIALSSLFFQRLCNYYSISESFVLTRLRAIRFNPNLMALVFIQHAMHSTPLENAPQCMNHISHG